MTNKCECYEQREVCESLIYSLDPNIKIIGICNGTKEREECDCKGNKAKCDFYPEIREEATDEETKECRDKQELGFYRWWVTEHNLKVEVATAFEKWLKDL